MVHYKETNESLKSIFGVRGKHMMLYKPPNFSQPPYCLYVGIAAYSRFSRLHPGMIIRSNIYMDDVTNQRHTSYKAQIAHTTVNQLRMEIYPLLNFVKDNSP